MTTPPRKLLPSGLVAVALQLALGEAAPAREPRPGRVAPLQMAVSASWRNAPLAPALRRLAEVHSLPLWVDRRVDPGQRITLVSDAQPLGELLEAIAAQGGAGTAQLRGAVYFGPAGVAAKLPALAADWRKDAAPRLKRYGDSEWSRLTTPRELANQLAAEAGCTLLNPEAIPHDLLPAGALEATTSGDRLMLVLVGFDLRWRPTEENATVLRVEPIDYASLRATRPRRPRTIATPGTETEKRFNLRVSEQPAESVLKQLTGRLGLVLEIDSSVSDLATRRVTFQVEQASVGELFDALGKAAGFKVRLLDGRVVVSASEEL